MQASGPGRSAADPLVCTVSGCRRRGKAFGEKKHLKRHIETVHPTLAPEEYRCDVCDYNTPRKDIMTRHLASERHQDRMKKANLSQSASSSVRAMDSGGRVTIPKTTPRSQLPRISLSSLSSSQAMIRPAESGSGGSQMKSNPSTTDEYGSPGKL
jgi:hypothetical protein